MFWSVIHLMYITVVYALNLVYALIELLFLNIPLLVLPIDALLAC